jgi:hypothetical protein
MSPHVPRCDTVRPPAPPALGGGMLGGYHREGLSPETKKLGVAVTRGLLTGLPGLLDGCDSLTLLEVLEVHRQVGTSMPCQIHKCLFYPDCGRHQLQAEAAAAQVPRRDDGL